MGKYSRGQFGETLTKNYTKKFSGTKSLPLPRTLERHNCTCRKPPIVKRSEKPIMGLKTNTNFIVSNAVENILAGL